MGIAVVFAVLFVYFGIRYLEGEPLFGTVYQLTTRFEQADGLLRGNAVKLSGVQIGEVAQVELLPRGQGVEVVMEIQEDVEIPEGSMAVVEGVAALDNVSVSIRPGAYDGPVVEDGASIQGYTKTSLLARVDSTLSGAEGTFGQAEALLAQTEQDLGIVLSNMQVASGEAAALLQSERARLHETIVDLRSTAAQMDALLVKLDRAAEEGGDSLAVAMQHLNAAMRRLDRSVGSIERSSTSLEQVVAQVESGRGTFGRMLYDESLYTRLDSAAMRLDAILADFQANPARYLDHLELVDVF